MHFPKVAMCSVHFPQWYKNKKISITWKTRTDSSTQHDLLSMEENVFVTGSKASTENMTSKYDAWKLNTVAKMYPQNLAVHLCQKLKWFSVTITLYLFFLKKGVWLLPKATSDHQEVFLYTPISFFFGVKSVVQHLQTQQSLHKVWNVRNGKDW